MLPVLLIDLNLEGFELILILFGVLFEFEIKFGGVCVLFDEVGDSETELFFEETLPLVVGKEILVVVEVDGLFEVFLIVLELILEGLFNCLDLLVLVLKERLVLAVETVVLELELFDLHLELESVVHVVVGPLAFCFKDVVLELQF